MNDHENELKKALNESGNYDVEKAKQATTAAISQYRVGLKKIERITWAYLIIAVAVGVYALGRFECASTTKAIVGYGVIMLVAYESTILMKLWYWIANTKITLLKELKLWQLQAIGSPSAIATTSLDEGTRIRQPGLSRWERLTWIAVLALTACAASILAHN